MESSKLAQVLCDDPIDATLEILVCKDLELLLHMEEKFMRQ